MDKERKMAEISPNEFEKALETKRNILILGNSGEGKTAKVYEYAEKHGLKVIDFDLAGRLAEEVTGIPAVRDAKAKDIEAFKDAISRIEALILKTDDKDTIKQLNTLLTNCNKQLELLKALDSEDSASFYTRTLDKELEEFFKVKGKGYILLFDEINQGTPDALNTMYRICYPNPKMRKWAGHDISECQIVACGNLADGSDGTVYLTDLPTPLLNRFFVFKLKRNNKETTEYLSKKYKNIPHVKKYITAMLEENISPRDIDLCLDILQYEHDSIFLETKLGEALTAKILDMQKNIETLDPAKVLKKSREIYVRFKKDGAINFGNKLITDEEELKDKFRELGLSEEEIVAITMEGEE